MAEARHLLKTELGWLRGFPGEAGLADWVCVPELGSGLPPRRVQVDGARLHRSTLTARKGARRIPACPCRARYPQLARSASRDRPVASETLGLLLELGQASLVLRLLKRTRARGVRRWADEEELERILHGARAHEMLHRPKRALELYRLALSRTPPRQLRDECSKHIVQLEP